MKTRMVPQLVMILLVASVPSVMAQSQSRGAKPKTADFRPGQVWIMNRGITVTILAIEDVPRVGKVVHVRVDKIPSQTCGEYGDIRLTRAIEHLAVTEKMMLKSGLVLSKDNIELPQSSIEAYRKWAEQKKQEIAKVPLQKAIFGEGFIQGPMICNFLPNQT